MDKSSQSNRNSGLDMVSEWLKPLEDRIKQDQKDPDTGYWVWNNSLWEKTLFGPMKTAEWCDRATIRICGNEWDLDGSKTEPKGEIDQADATFHRAVLVHFNYARPRQEGSLAWPLLNGEGTPTAFHERTIEIWVEKANGGISVTEVRSDPTKSNTVSRREKPGSSATELVESSPNSEEDASASTHVNLQFRVFRKPIKAQDPDAWEPLDSSTKNPKSYDSHRPANLRGLGICSWVWLPLYNPTNRRLVGVLTFEKTETVFNNEVIAQLKEGLSHLGKRLAELIHVAFEQRLRDAKEAIKRILQQNDAALEIIPPINQEISTRLDNGYGRIWFCDFFRRSVDPSKQAKLSRWYPPFPREFDQELPYSGSEATNVTPPRRQKTISVAGTVLKSPRSFIVYDTLVPFNEANIQRTIRPIRSLIAVPLVAETRRKNGKEGKETFGLFTINSPNPNTFCHYDQELVEQIAEDSNTILVRAVIRQMIDDSEFMVNQRQVLSEVLEQIQTTAKDLTASNKCAILLFSEIHAVDGLHYYIKQAYPTPEGPGGYIGSKVDRNFIEKLNGATSPLALEDPDQPDDDQNLWVWGKEWANYVYRNLMCAYLENTSSPVMVIPLRFNEHTLGLCVVWGTDEKHQKYTAVEKYGFRALSDRAAAAIYNAQTKGANSKFEEAYRLVMQSQDLREALQIVARMARELVEGTVAFLALLHPNEEDIRLPAISLDREYCLKESPILRFEYLKDRSEMGITGRVIRDRGFILIPDVPLPENMNECIGNLEAIAKFKAQYPEYHYTMLCRQDNYEENIPIRSELVVPILLPRHKREHVPGEPIIGALNVGHSQTGAFSDSDREAIARFGEIAAIVLERHNRPPNSMGYQVRRRSEYVSDIFVSLKFYPPARRAWVEKQIRSAARLLRRYTGYRLIIKSADVLGRIGEEVWSYIALCETMIADISGGSQNVGYEIGLAHTLGKNVVIIKDNHTSTIADLGDALFIDYVYEPDAGQVRREMQEKEFVIALYKHLKKLIPHRHYCICDVDGYDTETTRIRSVMKRIPPIFQIATELRGLHDSVESLGYKLQVMFRTARGHRISALYQRTYRLATAYVKLVEALRIEGMDRIQLRTVLGSSELSTTPTSAEAKATSLFSLIQTISIAIEKTPKDKRDTQEIERDPQPREKALEQVKRMLKEILKDVRMVYAICFDSSDPFEV